MQLHTLSLERMLVLSRYWLGNTDAQRAFDSHELGPPVRNQIARAYADLRLLQKRRHDVHKALEVLRANMEALDDTHDRFARALHGYLSALATTTSHVENAAWYRDMLDLLFPKGLTIINTSYADQAGMATSIEQQLTPEILARLASIQVGEHTLAEICRGWLDAGIALGERVIERERLQGATTGDGPDVPLVAIREVRSRWLRAVRAMVSAVALMDLPQELRDALIEPLERMVAQALRQRASRPVPPGSVDGPANGDAPGDDSGDVDGPTDDDINGPIATLMADELDIPELAEYMTELPGEDEILARANEMAAT